MGSLKHARTHNTSMGRDVHPAKQIVYAHPTMDATPACRGTHLILAFKIAWLAQLQSIQSMWAAANAAPRLLDLPSSAQNVMLDRVWLADNASLIPDAQISPKLEFVHPAPHPISNLSRVVSRAMHLALHATISHSAWHAQQVITTAATRTTHYVQRAQPGVLLVFPVQTAVHAHPAIA